MAQTSSTPSSQGKKLRGLVAMALARGARALQLVSLIQNTATINGAAGAVVAAAGNITGTITITMLQPGSCKVRAGLSYVPPGSGTTYAIVQYSKNGGGLVTVLAFANLVSGMLETSVTGLVTGDQMVFHFTTTAGDASITLGHGSTGSAASLSASEGF